jgi:membrane dipeptidase
MSHASRPLLVDGLNASLPSRDVFAALHRAGASAVHFTCAAVWAGFEQSMRELLALRHQIVEHDDLVRLVLEADDINRARDDGRVGIILGWQNSGGFADYLPFVEAFHALGLRVVQLTYNTANSVGSGCYESTDRGLTDFGRDLISELNRLGIVVDLSHVGPLTAAEAVNASRRPVAFSHTLPAALNDHPRNRSDDELRNVVERGGFVGATCYPTFLPRGADSDVGDFLEAIAYMVDLLGRGSVGIATDFTEGQPPEFWRYIGRDKGYGRFVVNARSENAPDPQPAGLEGNERLGDLRGAMAARGWDDELIAGVLGENWMRFLAASWAPEPA